MDARSFTLAAAVVLDAVLGEPPLWHPLVGFGNIAGWVDSVLFRLDLVKSKETLRVEPDGDASDSVGASSDVATSATAILTQRTIGALAVIVTVTPFVVAAAFLNYTWVGILLLYLCVGAKSLCQHATKVQSALEAGDLELARQRVGMIVSRDTRDMSEADISRATIESVLENGSDAIFGAIFWFMILGPAGAVLFRLSNTLDAMWGYKTEKYLHYGWAAARLDDVLCWIPSRLTAFTYALAGNFSLALKCWRRQARSWYSPNAGPVMSAGAGALALELGGAANYHGTLKERPILGEGRAPVATDIARATKLVLRSVIIWVTVIVVGGMGTCLHR